MGVQLSPAEAVSQHSSAEQSAPSPPAATCDEVPLLPGGRHQHCLIYEIDVSAPLFHFTWVPALALSQCRTQVSKHFQVQAATDELMGAPLMAAPVSDLQILHLLHSS